MVESLERGGDVAARQTLRSYATSWLSTRLARLKPSTRAKYANDLDHHILPELGDVYVDQLRPMDVGRFVAEQLEKGSSSWSVINRLRLLRAIARDAVADGVADRDFTARVSAPNAPVYDEEDPNLLDAAELRTVLDAVCEPWRAAAWVMAFTGLRWGELSALRWDDIDQGANVIRVQRSNWKGRAVAPKTRRSRRTVPLLPEVADELAAHRKRMVTTQHPGLGSGLIWPTMKGTMHAGSPLGRALDRATKATEATRITPHALRRTFNDLARRVADGMVVRAITGHVTEAMTEHYSVVDASEKMKAAAGVLRLVTAPKVEDPVEDLDRTVG